MTPILKIVVVFLVSVQLAQQASISNKYYDTYDLNNHLNNELTFHSSSNVLSTLKTKQLIRRKQSKSREEQGLLNGDRGSVLSFRPKRQLDQDAETDAEIISNDPKMFSYGKSMQMTTSDDEINEHQNEKLGSDSWNVDMDSSHKNSLGGLEDKPEEEDEARDSGSIQAHVQGNKQSFQDIISVNLDGTPKVAGQDNFSGSEAKQNNSTEIPMDPTLHSNSQQSNDRSSSLTTDTKLQDSVHIENDDHDKEVKVIVNKDYFTQNTQELDVAEEHFETNDDQKKKGALENLEKDKDIAITESETRKNEMGDYAVDTAHEETHLSGASKQNDEYVETHDKASEQILSKELDIDDDNGDLSEHFDNEDAEVFMHFPIEDSSSKASGQLKLLEDDSADYSEEGSGDMENDPTGSHETHEIRINVPTNNSGNHLLEISTTMDSRDFNLDSDADKGKESSADIVEDEQEIEGPIADPTAIVTNVNDPAKTLIPSRESENVESHEELAIPNNKEEHSKVDDHAVTYDPKTIVNPFNIDNASEISRHIGKAIGIIDSSEETIDGEESEGSGNSFLFHDTESDKNSLENGAMFKIDPRMLPGDTQPEDKSGSTTVRGGSSNVEEVTEESVLVHHYGVQLNTERNPVDEDDAGQDPANEDSIGGMTEIPVVVAGGESTSPKSFDSPIEEDTGVTIAQISSERGQGLFDTVSISENGSTLVLPAGINEMGIQKSEKTATAESEQETSSSSTGSFIVLGAIMATIVALLGYSVIKSHRQKQQNSRRQPDDDKGTELKEIDTLLQGSNGHGPANRLIVESDRLLSPYAENDKHELKPDNSYPIYQNGLHGKNGTIGMPNNVLPIEDPNDLSEVKIKPLNTIASNNSDAPNPQVANGVSSKNSPRNSACNNQNDEQTSPANNRGSRNYVTQPETAKIKMFIDHDSIPKTPIVIVKRGPANV